MAKKKEEGNGEGSNQAEVRHVVVRKFVAYGVKLAQGVGVDATDWPKLIPLMNAKYLRAATPADKDRRFVDVEVKV